MNHSQGGFTLVEAVIVIVITGVIAAVVAVFIVSPVRGYVDSARRAELTDVADTAVRRIGRDVRLALPNSIRLPNNSATAACLEFLPTVTGGRYRAACSDGDETCADALNFRAADTRFEVLGGLNSTPAANDQLVIYNLGIPGADAYEGSNRATIVAPLSAATITLAAPGKQFPLPSPFNRFHVVPASEQAVFYVCDGAGLDAQQNGTGTLYRFSGYGINAGVPAKCPAPADTTPILARNVSSCSFTYAPGITQRNALVSIQLQLTQRGESVPLYQEVHVSNVP
ncbi:MAG TPA: prepilin-type N-terminal cleavage/methylation domain-containing protein [Noviherbaspirillum sp.]|nr:prepilin-type N-terminal cleavage/methylation domain-containing protein [Noviherbaspirillum sp.]